MGARSPSRALLRAPRAAAVRSADDGDDGSDDSDGVCLGHRLLPPTPRIPAGVNPVARIPAVIRDDTEHAGRRLASFPGGCAIRGSLKRKR
jgi:hypothetical protein